jgi:hypothetical protein
MAAQRIRLSAGFEIALGGFIKEAHSSQGEKVESA